MKTRWNSKFLALLLVGALAVVSPTWTMASTAPCTQVSNTATLQYTVGGVDPTGGTGVTSAPAAFNVGVKSIVTVTNSDVNEVSVVPGATKYALTFTIQNDGNTIQDYDLNAEAASNGTASPFDGANDSFDGTTIEVYIEDGTTAGFQSGEDTLASSIDNLAADGGSQVAYIVYSPTDLAEDNLETAVYHLVATGKWADDTAMGAAGGVTPTAAQVATCNGGTAIDLVYGDADGSGSDGDKDGAHSDDGAFEVSTATIGITKGYTVVSDPINGASSPKAIPGAVVRYSIAIANTGASSAVLSTITDGLAATLQVVSTADNATWAVTGSTRATSNGTLTVDTADANADGLGHSDTSVVAGTVTATLTTVLAADGANGYAAGELKSGETLTLTFDATVQ